MHRHVLCMVFAITFSAERKLCGVCFSHVFDHAYLCVTIPVITRFLTQYCARIKAHIMRTNCAGKGSTWIGQST